MYTSFPTGIWVYKIKSNGPNITKQHLHNNTKNFNMGYLSHFHKLGLYGTRDFYSSEKSYHVTFWAKASCSLVTGYQHTEETLWIHLNREMKVSIYISLSNSPYVTPHPVYKTERTGYKLLRFFYSEEGTIQAGNSEGKWDIKIAYDWLWCHKRSPTDQPIQTYPFSS